MVRNMVGYVHDFFRIFLKSFHKFFFAPEKRELVRPGAVANFRGPHLIYAVVLQSYSETYMVRSELAKDV